MKASVVTFFCLVSMVCVENLNLNTANMQQNAMQVLWSNVSREAKAVELRWKEANDSDWTLGQQFRANVTQFTLQGLTSDTQFYFSLRTLSSALVYSPDVSCTAETLAVLRGTNVRPSEVSSSSITVTWMPALSTSLAGQLLFTSFDGGATWGYNEVTNSGPIFDPAVNSATIAALLPDTAYLVRVDSLFIGALFPAPDTLFLHIILLLILFPSPPLA